MQFMSGAKTKSSREKVSRRRERSDIRSRAFKAQAHRQSLAIARSDGEGEDQAFVDAVTDQDVGMPTSSW